MNNAKVDAFLRAFEEKAKLILNDNFESVILFGSVSKGHWNYGSDIDLILYAKRATSLRDKRLLFDAYWHLNEKYQLGLERAPVLHPIIFIADSSVKRLLLNRLLDKRLFRDWQAARKAWKRVALRQGSIKSFAYRLT